MYQTVVYRIVAGLLLCLLGYENKQSEQKDYNQSPDQLWD